MRIVDANIILRYLLADSEVLSEQAAQIIDDNQTDIPIEVLCEVVYVLEKVYKVDRKEICEELTAFIDNSNTLVPYYNAVMSGLRFYAESKLDFVDSILAGYVRTENAEVFTFDKDLKKLIEQIENKD